MSDQATTQLPTEELAALRADSEMLAWIKQAIKWNPSHSFHGAIHILNADAHAYNAYIYTYKCGDKQGQIANLTRALHAIANDPFACASVQLTANTALKELAEHIKKTNEEAHS